MRRLPHQLCFHRTWRPPPKRQLLSLTCRSENCNLVMLDARFYSTPAESLPKEAPSYNAAVPERRNTDTVYTPSHIQLISDGLYKQIFVGSSHADRINHKSDLVQKCKRHLEQHSLWNQRVPPVPSIDFKIPQLEGTSIDGHFHSIAEQQTTKYKKLLSSLLGQLPPIPTTWVQKYGWTKYMKDGTTLTVAYPSEDALVFDVETCVLNGPLPVMACAASSEAWYSWCSSSVMDGVDRNPNDKIGLEDLIPLESEGSHSAKSQWSEKIVVGHNVSFDRARIKEQYFLEETKLRFIDTMSLHIAVSGITSFQRVLKMTMKNGLQALSREKREELLQAGSLEWNDISSLNNLKDVHKLYCDGQEEVQKDIRDTFITGRIQDIRNDFQNLMTYCAKDVRATQGIFAKLMPMFYERFPHPVTLSGMLEMGMPYLPINSNWNKYIEKSEEMFMKLEHEMKSVLMQKANDALTLQKDERYKEDPWLWDLDWKVPKTRKKKTDITDSTAIPDGLPAWYRKLFYKKSEEGYLPGPAKISTSMQIIPKLLRLCWFGFPLHHTKEGGWGYLIKKPSHKDEAQERREASDNILTPDDSKYHIFETDLTDETESKQFPFEKWETIWDRNKNRLLQRLNAQNASSDSRNIETADREVHCRGEEAVQEIEDFLKALNSITNLGLRAGKAKKNVKTPSQTAAKADLSPHPNCEFRPLPHKDGANYRVGNPLAKDFLTKMEDGILTSYNGEDVANKLVRLSKMVSYWRNNKDRIMGQIAVWLKSSDSDPAYGAILPQVSVAGTLTRRAVERTWLTASNAYTDRVGSELKGMIQAPPGHYFVGADVDSQELWIASILGDAQFTGFHGSTALGWMTLQGEKSSGTDMHSKTAALIGIGRDQAKILNYGRIYGAGVTFADRLLQQFNHELSPSESKEKATAMYKMTKGERKYLLNNEGKELARSVPQFAAIVDQPFSREDIKNLMKCLHYPPVGYMELIEKQIWDGGTESEMFNRLEEIAQMECPVTPILHCCISRSLVPSMVQNDFMTSRVNWVVQSSAVDYLHLMLTCMRWLIEKYDIKARFMISVHDEVRYIVKSEDRYRAALALQITNLLTRAMCAHQLGMKDLPQAVAFFSCVDIDKVFRKEVTQDCKTPSNPEGLSKGYNIGEGEAVDIHKILEITKGSLKRNSTD